MAIVDRLTDAVRVALAAAGLPLPKDIGWEPPRQAGHGDYATNVALVLARDAGRPPRQIADLIVKHLPSLPEVERIELAGPGFLNVFLSPLWCGRQVLRILADGARYGHDTGGRGKGFASSSSRPTQPAPW